MKNYNYKPKGVCSVNINFDIEDDGTIHNLKFEGGCNGNLKAIGKLVEGMPASEVSERLRGNDCKGRGTSCADQLAMAIDSAIA